MILLSNIIKAEYVICDIDKQKNNHIHRQVSTYREDLFRIYNQREILLKEAEEKAAEIVSTAIENAQLEITECKKMLTKTAIMQEWKQAETKATKKDMIRENLRYQKYS